MNEYATQEMNSNQSNPPVSDPIHEALACLVFSSYGSMLSKDNTKDGMYYAVLQAVCNHPKHVSTQTLVRDTVDISLLHRSVHWEDCLSTWAMSYPDSNARIKASQAMAHRVAQQWPDLLEPLIDTLCKGLEKGGDTRAASAMDLFPHEIEEEIEDEIDDEQV